jgi:DNA-binding response OmpR family regulator
MRVLVVEDFEVLARSIGTGLRREGMAVDVALDGINALERLAVTRYDVVVLDRDLPGIHGDDICRRITADGADSRVLMLTAAGTVKDRVDGLGLGADDYCPSRSTSPNSSPGCAPSRVAPLRPRRPPCRPVN